MDNLNHFFKIKTTNETFYCKKELDRDIYQLLYLCSLRYIERLKARNERLTAALERRKAESEQLSITLNRLESDCSALQMALHYWYVSKTHLTHQYKGLSAHMYIFSVSVKIVSDMCQNSKYAHVRNLSV